MVSPFSCFSPSYSETLPRSHASSNPHSALAHLNSDFGPPSPPGNRGASIDFTGERGRGSPPASTRGPGLGGGNGPKILKRRSYGHGGERRLTKDLIGLPTNFVHEGHVGRPLVGAAAIDLSNTLASVAAALETPNLHLPSSPSFPTTPLSVRSLPTTPYSTPLCDHTNAAPDLPPTPTTPTSHAAGGGAHRKVARKAPPPITASVIRQAGPQAVFGTGGMTTPPPAVTGLLTSAGSPLGREEQGEGAEELLPPLAVEEPLGVPSPSVILGERREGSSASGEERKKSLPPLPETSAANGGAECVVDELGRPMESDGMGGYMTASTKKRWDGTMAEIEAALSL